MMNTSTTQKLRDYLRQSLNDVGDHSDLADDHSLFLSGRLDSLSMTRLVMFLEESFGMDFGDFNFEVDLIDSMNAIQTLVDSQAAKRA